MTFAWKGSPIVGQGLPRIASILLIDGVSNEHVHDGDDYVGDMMMMMMGIECR